MKGKQVPLTPKAVSILLLLVQNGGHVLEKKEIMDHIWPDSFVEEATLAQNIFTLRRALGESPTGPQYLETVPKRGYRFIAEVKELRGEVAVPAPQEPPPSLPAIAVLPFDHLTPGNDDEYLGLGMADALITMLSNIQRIIVRPTRAVRKYNLPYLNPVTVGRELMVDSVLTGSIQRAGDRIRVTVQLISVKFSHTVWSGKFDDHFTDIFTVQDSISAQVVKALTLQLTTQEKEGLAKYYFSRLFQLSRRPLPFEQVDQRRIRKGDRLIRASDSPRPGFRLSLRRTGRGLQHAGFL
jgi:TolB-like protein